MSNAQLKNVLWSLHDQQPLANLIVRSHIHRCYNIGDPALNFQGWVTPGLQGLGGKFGTRKCDTLPIHFGFLVLEVQDERHWTVEAHIAPLKMQKSEINAI